MIPQDLSGRGNVYVEIEICAVRRVQMLAFDDLYCREQCFRGIDAERCMPAPTLAHARYRAHNGANTAISPWDGLRDWHQWGIQPRHKDCRWLARGTSRLYLVCCAIERSTGSLRLCCAIVCHEYTSARGEFRWVRVARRNV